MKVEPRLLYFIAGPAPTKDQEADAREQRKRGFRVEFRNAQHVRGPGDGDLEPCDAVAGEKTPDHYRDAFPWADDFEPDDVPDVGTEFIGDDGHAYVRAVRGDGVGFNMLLSLAAPAPNGSGAPSHGPFAGVDHHARIKAADAAREAAEAKEGEGDGTGKQQPPPPPPQPPKAKRKRPNWQRNS